ncbi:peptidylprolyl isomerase [Devosia sp. J2-20]|uniref:peptidylprolyl isomerase n=1 Tax=Devosia sp. J2-20 TaxID=3026161 RepID=UPI00249BC2CF|nr:peptidylprolyl isomerase [Devosia sp. J2-20]WDQ99842.1 peptidylprolyl isomerase [Devosia sp. J2-20]
MTEEAVRAEYDKLVADFQPSPEIRASHILVPTEEEAQAVKAELDGGADFATLAKEKSIDPGAANGGDLGFFGKGMMVAPFETAAYGLTEIGQVSEPVQSQFGWHVIRLEEKRDSAPPAFEQVAPQLQQQLLMTTFDDTVAKLMEGVAIDIPDAELSAAVDAQTETEAPAQ